MVPLDHPLAWEAGNLRHYQWRRISNFASLADRHLESYDLIDCGAFIGLFAAQFCEFSDKVSKLIAVEPNPQVFRILELNAQRTRVAEIECLNVAVADYQGSGWLVAPTYDSGVEARHLLDDPTGEVEVVTLNSVLERRRCSRMAIKLDIEGYEVPALCSARDALRSLNKLVLFVEFHKAVLDRIGATDLAALERISAIRPFSWVNAADLTPIDPSRDVFAQVGQSTQCDLIGASM